MHLILQAGRPAGQVIRRVERNGQDMTEIKPMDESYIHSTCLHDGPIDTATWTPGWDSKQADLPPHPWDDGTMVQLTRRHGLPFCGGGAWGRDFMREMIHRHGTCAILAWEGRQVVGQLQFYPMALARLIDENWTGRKDPSPVLDFPFASRPEEDEAALWVQCVMTARPYVRSASSFLPSTTTGTGPTVVVSDSGRRHRTREEAGARKGLGLRLVQALLSWAKQHGWKRIVKVAHCDLDWFYGIQGGGGKAFWLKAGFHVADTLFKRPWEPDAESNAIIEAQMNEKGMAERDVWTWYRMVYEM